MLFLVRVPRLALLAILLAGCVTLPVEQRTTQGPTAEDMWLSRVTMQNGRAPTFEERGYWQEQIDRRITRYLNDHPEVANSYDVTVFRYEKQVTVGMTKEQVMILLGAPQSTVTDAAEMEKLARRYWPDIKDKAKEVWVYFGGWRFFFAGDRLIDITQYVPRDFRLG